jgi:PPM family protein phosphatase
MPTSAGRSDAGRVRKANEDAFLADETLSLYAVADGMGGYEGSEIASRLVIDTLKSFIRASRHDAGITWPFGFNTNLTFEANQLKSAVQLANQEVRYRAQRDPALDGMGSTLIAVMLAGTHAVFANVGDSRLYLWRRGTITQLSEDDSWAAAMLRAGADREVVGRHEMRHVLTRAIGPSLDFDLTVQTLDVQADDVLLLCSDGLYGPIGSDGIARVLAASGDDLDAAADALVGAANEAGGPDNISAVLVRVATPGERRSGRGLSDASGQSMAEYVAAAGILVTAGLVISGMLAGAFRDFLRSLVHELSFLSP